MRLREWHINGFGVFNDLSLRDLPAGMAVFLGDNESGKTTLMQFVRTVLFGFPGGRSHPNDYPPLRGGNHGGSLLVRMADGRDLTIERAQGSVAIRSDSGTLTGEPADVLLGGLTRQTFERVFAIGLSDLQNLEVLSQEEVRSRLLAAGAGLGDISLATVKSALDKELSSLLTQRTSKAELHGVRQELAKVNSAIAQQQTQSTEYARLQERCGELRSLLEQWQEADEQLRHRLARVDQLLKAREPWLGVQQACSQAATLCHAEIFPADGVTRFDALKGSIADASEQADAREDTVRGLQGDLSSLTVEQPVLEQADAIEALVGEQEKLSSAISDAPIVRAQVQQAEGELNRRLQELGPDWNPERLESTDVSVQVRQYVLDMAQQLDRAEDHLKDTRRAEQGAAEMHQDASAAATASAEKLAALPDPGTEGLPALQQRRDAIRRLRPLVVQTQSLSDRLVDRRAAASEAADSAPEAFEGGAPAAAIPTWLPPVAAIVLVVLAVLSLLQHAVLPGIVLLLGAPAIWLLLRRGSGTAASSESARQQADHERIERLERAQQAQAAELVRLEEELSKGQDEVVRVAEAAGLSSVSGLVELEALAAEVERTLEQLHDHDAARLQFDEAEGRAGRFREALDRATTERGAAEQALGVVEQIWAAWLAARDFAAETRPAGFEAVLGAVERARVAGRDLDTQLARANLIEQYLADTREKLGRVLLATGRSLSGEPGVQEIVALRQALEASRQAQQQHDEWERQARATTEEARRLRESARREEAESAALLEAAGATDEEHFRRLDEEHRQWQAAQETLRTNQNALQAIAGTADVLQELEQELAATDDLHLQTEREQLDQQRGELTGRQADANQELGVCVDTITRMAHDERLADLLLQERTLQERLRDGVKRWAALALCRQLLEQTQVVYEQERQPQVIKDAERLLKTFLGDRYRLVAALEEQTLALEDDKLTRKLEKQWSEGLADQVYLALRLALAKGFGECFEPLPVILDDILVKFDPARQQGAAKALLEFARTHQVLVFSCHPELKGIIETAWDDLDDAPEISYYRVEGSRVEAFA